MQSELRRLIVKAIREHRRYVVDMSVNDMRLSEREVARKLGWQLLRAERGWAFWHGRSLLESCDALLPPPSHDHWRGPSRAEAQEAPFYQTWGVCLMPHPTEPPRWEIGGTMVHLDGSVEIRRWLDLIYVDRAREWARTTEGWVALGLQGGRGLRR